MTSKSEKRSDKAQGLEFPVPMDLENMAEVNYTALNAAGIIGQRWCDALTVMNGEMLDFVGRRLKQDMVIPADLARCSTTEQVFQLYSEFFKKAVNQYVDEAATLAHISANFVGAATKIVDEEAAQVHKIAPE